MFCYFSYLYNESKSINRFINNNSFLLFPLKEAIILKCRRTIIMKVKKILVTALLGLTIIAAATPAIIYEASAKGYWLDISAKDREVFRKNQAYQDSYKNLQKIATEGNITLNEEAQSLFDEGYLWGYNTKYKNKKSIHLPSDFTSNAIFMEGFTAGVKDAESQPTPKKSEEMRRFWLRYDLEEYANQNIK